MVEKFFIRQKKNSFEIFLIEHFPLSRELLSLSKVNLKGISHICDKHFRSYHEFKEISIESYTIMT